MNILPIALLLMLLQNSPISGVLQGIVVKAGTNEAVPNARVELRRADIGRGANYPTWAHEDGRFSFETCELASTNCWRRVAAISRLSLSRSPSTRTRSSPGSDFR